MERFSPWDELSVLHELGVVSEDPSSEGGRVPRTSMTLDPALCAVCPRPRILAPDSVPEI